MMGVQHNAPGGKGPYFGRASATGTGAGMVRTTGPNHPTGTIPSDHVRRLEGTLSVAAEWLSRRPWRVSNVIRSTDALRETRPVVARPRMPHGKTIGKPDAGKSHVRCTPGTISSSGVEVPRGGRWPQPQAKGNCVVVRRRGEEAGGEIATRGTRTAYEARRSGRAGTERRSPLPSRGRSANAAGARRRVLILSGDGSAGVPRCSSTHDVIVGWDGAAQAPRCPTTHGAIVEWDGTTTAARPPRAAEQSAAATVPAGITIAGKGQTQSAGRGRTGS